MSDEAEYVREICEAATPGPWTITTNDPGAPFPTHAHIPEVLTVYDGEWDQMSVPNARAIALYGSIWAEVLAVIERLRDHWSMCTHEDHEGDPCLDCAAFEAYRAAVRAHHDRTEPPKGVNPGFHDDA